MSPVGTTVRDTAEAISRWPATPAPRIRTCSGFLLGVGGGSRGSVMRRIERSPHAAAIRIFFWSRLFGSALSMSSSSSSSGCCAESKLDGRMEAGGNEMWCTGVPRWIVYEHANFSSSTSLLRSSSPFAGASLAAACEDGPSRTINSSSSSCAAAFDFPDDASLRTFFGLAGARHSMVIPDSWPQTRTSESVVGREASGRG